MMPHLSVIIPVYNQGYSIERALDSVAAQSLPLEVVVVDDASTDDGPARVAAWAAGHSLPLRSIRQPERRYALAARLAGLEAATAPDIMFLDADDTLAGVDSLARVLERKRETGCQVAHFRSLAVSPAGEPQGEYLINAPLASDILRGDAVFAAFAARPYPPVLNWGKIFSRELLEEVAPLARGERIFRFEDKFLVSLLMLHARSYLGCQEYVYTYRLSENWPLEKFAGRVHDLLTIRRIMLPLMEQRSIAPEITRNFSRFLERRLTVNMGSLCMLAEERLFNGEEPALLLARLRPYLDDEQLFEALLSASCNNVDAVCDLVQRIHNEF